MTTPRLPPELPVIIVVVAAGLALGACSSSLPSGTNAPTGGSGGNSSTSGLGGSGGNSGSYCIMGRGGSGGFGGTGPTDAGGLGGAFGYGGTGVISPFRDPACGGTVQATGTTPSGAFAPSYVFAHFYDAPDQFVIVIAGDDTNQSEWLDFYLQRDPATGSFLGHATPVVIYTSSLATGGQELTVPIELEVSAIPASVAGTDGGTNLLTAAFTIEKGCFSVSGNFSTPLCSP